MECSPVETIFALRIFCSDTVSLFVYIKYRYNVVNGFVHGSMTSLYPMYFHEIRIGISSETISKATCLRKIAKFSWAWTHSHTDELERPLWTQYSYNTHPTCMTPPSLPNCEINLTPQSRRIATHRTAFSERQRAGDEIGNGCAWKRETFDAGLPTVIGRHTTVLLSANRWQFE